jgi:voltage-gated potassium channel
MAPEKQPQDQSSASQVKVISSTAARANILLPYLGIALTSLFAWLSPINSRVYTSSAIIAVVVATALNLELVTLGLPKIRSFYPGIYKIGMLLIIPTIVLNLARIDLVLSMLNPHSFSMPLTRTDALYFTVTTLTTVSYGDIHPATEAARQWVTVQIVAGFMITGYVLVKALSAEK